jgi:hypothetical protein
MTTKTAGAATYLFLIHGIGIEYEASSPHLAVPACKLLGHFQVDWLGEAVPLKIRFEAVATQADIPVAVPSGGRLLSSATGTAVRDGVRSGWQCRVVEDHGRLIADFNDDGCVVIDRARGIAEGYLVRSERMSSEMVEWYVHFTLGELVKQCGLYAVHATALEKNGRGVLIPGYSGRGKTTSFLSLLRAGYRYLSDDTPWIRLYGESVEVLSFPMKVDVTDQTIAFFPELREAAPGVLQQGVHKKYFKVEDVYPGGIGKRCRPAVILFPQVVDSSTSCLEPLAKSHAFQAILPQTMVVHDSEIARRQFHALSTLIQVADCYTLFFGRDVLELPKLIAPLLEAS